MDTARADEGWLADGMRRLGQTLLESREILPETAGVIRVMVAAIDSLIREINAAYPAGE